MSLKLVILGSLMKKNRYPYEIKQLINESYLKNYIKVQDGTLYYAIDKCYKEKLIEVVEVRHENKRPSKTIYRITDQGRIRFQQELYDQLKESFVFRNPIFPALIYTEFGNTGEIAVILEDRLKHIEEHLRDLKNNRKVADANPGLFYILKNVIIHYQAECVWLRNIIQDAKDHKLGETKSLSELFKDI
ncbi:PadR family transcriptional regulator [Scopulibacillus cellulosilyticus]|uniref:PadR family transcriptional regulator n=1 Tax=Scopulibacillus cellulosilyticus TaxID=2665665 RepID=A0ABW2Q0A7_9BACL